MTAYKDRTLGELASQHPAATRVFLRHRLDFCCGGKRTLDLACSEAGLDADLVARELDGAAAGSPGADWATRPLGELADYIVQRYHESLRRDVPPLLEAARKVERVHAGKPGVPVGLADALTRTWAELVAHMQKEEQVLFPMLRRGARGEAVYMPVRAMEHEHDAHGEALAHLRQLTGDHVAPPHACATWRALYDGLVHFEAELMEHVALENNVLFLRAARAS